MKTFQGTLVAPARKRFALVVSRFNEFITQKLLDGALDAFRRHGADEAYLEVFWSPGCFEIPLIARKLADSGRYLAVVCLGVVIRGGTEHHRYIASEAAKGVAQTALNTGVPCTFGILTCDTIEQAIERAGSKAGNKGADAACSAIEMVNLLAQVPPSHKGK